MILAGELAVLPPRSGPMELACSANPTGMWHGGVGICPTDLGSGRELAAAIT